MVLIMIRRLICLLFLSLTLSVSTLAQSTYKMTTIGIHDDEVLGVFVNSKNTMFASCSVDETIKIWSLPDGKLLKDLTGHFAEVNNISFSGNDKWLASGSADETVRIWDVESGTEIKTLLGHTDQVIGVYFDPSPNSTLVASTSFDKTVKLWDYSLGSEIKTLYGHTAPTNNVAYSYDGLYIASCSDDKSIIIWSTDLTSKKPVKVLTGHDAPVLTCIFSFDSRKLASSDRTGTIIIWSMPEGTILQKFKAHNELCQDLSFAEDNVSLVSGSLDKKVKLWNADTGENMLDFDTGVEIWSVDLVSDASIITLGCADGTVRLLKRSEKGAKAQKKGSKK